MVIPDDAVAMVFPMTTNADLLARAWARASAQAVDLLAERIRALGEKAPGSATEFKKLSSVADGNAGFDDLRMIKDLYESNLLVVSAIKKALTAAEKAGDVSTADLLTQRITAHEKAAWMLKASLPANAKVKLAV